MFELEDTSEIIYRTLTPALESLFYFLKRNWVARGCAKLHTFGGQNIWNTQIMFSEAILQQKSHMKKEKDFDEH